MMMRRVSPNRDHVDPPVTVDELMPPVDMVVFDNGTCRSFSFRSRLVTSEESSGSAIKCGSRRHQPAGPGAKVDDPCGADGVCA